MPKPYLLCIGHRGAMGHAPENTLNSFRKALELGARCIEMDVYFVDGRLVVFHDDRLERLTDGKGSINEHSFDYLRSLDAGDGQQIPTLEEVCDVIAGHAMSQVCINIELKGLATATPVAKLISVLIERGWDKDRFLVSSFHHSELLMMKRQCQDIKLGVLISDNALCALKFAEDLGAFSVNPCLQCVSQQFIEVAHTKGFKVFVYPVDLPQDIASMHTLGADGVFTDYPERVLQYYSQGDAALGWG